VCGEHLSEDAVCVECAADVTEFDVDDARWAWFARHRAVKMHGLRPFFDGSELLDDGDYYDEWDLRPLQARGADGLDADADVDFFDS